MKMETNLEQVCSECERVVDLVDAKATSFYYETVLCYRCELRWIETGYWTEEKKIEILRKRKDYRMI